MGTWNVARCENTAGGRRTNILSWVLQVLLAVVFCAHGLLLLLPPASVVEQMNAALARWFQLSIGVAEVDYVVRL